MVDGLDKLPETNREQVEGAGKELADAAVKVLAQGLKIQNREVLMLSVVWHVVVLTWADHRSAVRGRRIGSNNCEWQNTSWLNNTKWYANPEANHIDYVWQYRDVCWGFQH